MFDRCLNCGGDGGSCALTKGIYTKNYRVYGKTDTPFYSNLFNWGFSPRRLLYGISFIYKRSHP